jgi:hypothetical protein
MASSVSISHQRDEKCFGDMTLKKDILVTAEGQEVYVIRLSPDGRYLALGDKQGMVEVSTSPL